jgi:hypothetical protein
MVPAENAGRDQTTLMKHRTEPGQAASPVRVFCLTPPPLAPH